MAESTQAIRSVSAPREHEFVRAIGLFDGTMIVVGSMIGSGIFIVAADISRQTGSPGGLLLTWILTGLLTISAALSYGELAALFPHAGGQYVYLREAYSPLWGFLYGWTLFLVIQTGTIAAVAVGFARYLGVIFPSISPQAWIIHPISLGSKYAISLSVQQLVGILMILFITFLNTLGVRLGKLIQNIFTSAKTLSLMGLILLGIFVGRNAGAIAENFSHLWVLHNPQTLEPGANFLKNFVPTVSASNGAFGLFVAFGVAQVGSLFSADAWNNIGFTAAEVKNPKRDVALSMTMGTIIVITLYCLANLAYLLTLPLVQIQTVPDDRVASAALNAIFGPVGAAIMAVAIIISTFGCNNGLILAGARVSYAMARDGLFFRSTGTLNHKGVPGSALLYQGIWVTILILLRTRHVDAAGAVSYGNLYNDLLAYVVFSVLIFYVLTIAGIFVLRVKRPEAERPYRALGYPFVPLLYIAAAAAIMFVLLLYRTQTAWPGLVIVLLGVPVYLLWSRRNSRSAPEKR
ncbi:MAG: amino acid permease [Acidobacteria bacterium Pan2503]|uniref:Amino acid permease n=1 Tax=Candidatus Acidiferrum panamense TaxID=2741543 RepID=A0A7V8NW61_9BACT|nr:amino acid permease [Candidatus Acidoferrum panamensis]